MGAEIITATTLPATCDSIRCNHAHVGGLISLLLKFATEWNKGLGDILSQNKVHLSCSSANHQDILPSVQLWKIMLSPGLCMAFPVQCSFVAMNLIISIYHFCGKENSLCLK